MSGGFLFFVRCSIVITNLLFVLMWRPSLVERLIFLFSSCHVNKPVLSGYDA
ncbi:hypothetical protein SAMN05444008_111125 [Cnuella takakiae]|uniref:Uncharacterized protein n=1 Tax=Cnuella takakiae TaxID=1302690 RepID=A0A1M5DY56_9BACT|nr:hypothetical protein SAMN05444008_111125 [Cnuella takakiae]